MIIKTMIIKTMIIKKLINKEIIVYIICVIYNMYEIVKKPTKVEKIDNYSILGFIIYVIFFILIIPYLLIQYKRFDILSAYFPNLDNIATVLGYMGGPPVQYPGEIWKYLRESCDENLFEFLSIGFIHYVSLLGLIYIVSHYTNKYKSISKGWAISFFMLFITYIIPGHLIQNIQKNIGNIITKRFKINSMINYLSVVFSGLLLVYLLIFIEEKLIHKYSFDLARLIQYIAGLLYININ